MDTTFVSLRKAAVAAGLCPYSLMKEVVLGRVRMNLAVGKTPRYSLEDARRLREDPGVMPDRLVSAAGGA